jgi:hypothetical protein
MHVRVAEPIEFEQFCVADAAGEWLSRNALPNGMIVLTYPRCTMICDGCGDCTVVRVVGTNIDAYFNAALEALDEVA